VTAPYPRRRDPQPLGHGWEVAVVAGSGILLAVALAALTGLAAASASFGNGWVWPRGTVTVVHVLGGLLTGHPGRGLPPAQAARVAGPVAVYAGITVCEAMLGGIAVTAGVLAAGHHRPGDARRGLATRGEAEQALGCGRLRAAKEIIRPDLYPPNPAKGPSKRGAR